MPKVGHDPIGDRTDCAIVSVVQGENAAGRAEVFGIMDIDEHVIHAMPSVDKDQSEPPPFVA